MEFIKRSTQLPFREIAQNAKGDVIAVLDITPKVRIFRLINQGMVKLAEFSSFPFAISVSPSGQYVAYTTGTTAVLFNTYTKQTVNTNIGAYCDLVSVNDAGEILLLRQESNDGAAIKVVGSTVSQVALGPLAGNKFIINGTVVKVADAKRYGVPGALVTATDLIIGFYGDHVVVADGKVIGPSSTADIGERILESTNCGRYIVVRTATKYVAVHKVSMSKSTLTATSLLPVLVPRKIAVGPTLKAHTGEQVTVTQGEGTLTISGPVAWIGKFISVTVNATKFDVAFVDGSVTLTTAILETAVTQLYFSDSEFSMQTEVLAYAPTLFATKSVIAPTEYGFVSGNDLVASLNPSKVGVKIDAPTQYIVMDRTPLMDARTLLSAQRAIAISSYEENT